MSAVKRFVKSEEFQRAFAWVAAQYMKFVYLTTRWTMVSPPAFEAMRRAGDPFILCFWHNRLMIVRPGLPRDARVHMLISAHRDGQLISRAIAHFGVTTIAGSTSRGGLGALREMQRLLRAGSVVGITPDGPRGPRMRASPGLATVASRMSVPVFAVSFSSTRRRLFKSWDRFLLPLPFGRVTVVMKGPIDVRHNAASVGLEEMRRRIEDALNEATREADRSCGHPPVEPAPEAEAAKSAEKAAQDEQAGQAQQTKQAGQAQQTESGA